MGDGLYLLGQFRLEWGGETHLFSQALRQQSLLAYLAMHRQTPISRRFLAGLLWPEAEAKRAAGNFRRLLHRFRQQFPHHEGLLEISNQSMQWREGISLDVEAFREDIKADSFEGLRAAVESYKGDFLPDCHDDWVLPIRHQLEQLAMEGLVRLVTLCKARRDIEGAMGHASRLLSLDPHHETAHRERIRLFALQGQRAEALKAYESYEALCQEQLGMEPDEETEDLFLRLQSAEAPDLDATEAPVEAAPLVGQREIWEGLSQCWGRVIRGKLQLVLLRGPAGVGKSKCAHAFADSLVAQGVTAVRIRSYAIEAHQSYAAATALLRAHPLPPLKLLWRQELVRLLPELLSRHPDLDEPEMPQAGWQTQRLHEAIARAVVRFDQPLLLLLDDVQWCDPQSIAALHSLCLRAAPDAPILVLGTCRELEGALRSLWQAVDGHQRARLLEVQPLDREDAASLARYHAQAALEEGEIERLYRETQGNPLHLIEAVRSGSYREEASTADHFQGYVERHLEQLAPLARRVVECAALIERECALELLQGCIEHSPPPAATAPLSRLQLYAAVCELLNQQVLEEPKSHRYRFLQPPFGEAVARQLSPSLRLQLHRSIASALEASEALEPELQASLAHHLERAGEASRSWPHWLAAARHARSRYALQEAGSYYQKLLDAPPQEALRIEAQIEMAQEVLFLEGEYEKALELLQLPEASSPQKRAQAALGRGRIFHELGQIQEAEQQFAEALASFEQQEAPAQVLQALHQIAVLHSQRGEYEEAKALHSRAMDIARATEDLESQGQILHSIATIHVEQGQHEEAIALYEDALQIQHQIGSPRDEGRILNNLAVIYMEQGHYSQAISMCEQNLHLRRKIGDRAGEALATNNLAAIIMRQGDLLKAKDLYEQALQVWRHLGHMRGEGYALNNVGAAYAELGHNSTSRLYLEQSLSIIRQIGDSRLEAFHHLFQAQRCRYALCFEEALEHLGRAQEAFEALRHQHELCRCDCERGFLQLGLGRIPEAEATLAQAQSRIRERDLPAQSRLWKTLAQLSDAVAGAKDGRELRAGQLPEDLPEALRLQAS